MRRVAIPMTGFLVLVCTAGSIHGIWTDRWRPSAELQEAIERINRVPASFGEWTSTINEIEPEEMASAGIRGYIYRTYRHSQNESVISILLVCGQGGPTSVHEPDVCYAGSGYQIPTGKRRVTVAENQDFWMNVYSKPDAIVPDRLQFFWSWSSDASTWLAPNNPRLSLARYPAVFKLYVVRNLTQKEKVDEGPIRIFLSEFLPELEKTLRPPSP